MCVRPAWVKFCSPVSQFVKVSLIILFGTELICAPCLKSTFLLQP